MSDEQTDDVDEHQAAAGVVDEPGRAHEQLRSRTCETCGEPVVYAGTGRPPRYCSQTCRQRGWAIRKARRELEAAGDPRPKVVREVVERVVETRPKPPAPRRPRVPTSAREWLTMLEELSLQLRTERSGAGALVPVRREHWHHSKLYTALVDAADALDEAHPGGLDQLAARRRR